jgi:hypothetical protein
MRVVGDGPGSILSCSNTTSADAVVYFSGAGGKYGGILENITLNGNANITNGLHDYHVHEVIFSNVRVRNVASRGFYLDNVVLATVSNPQVSTNDPFVPWTIALPPTGIEVSHSNAVTIITPLIEGVSGAGILVSNSTLGTQIVNGTSEGNGIGISLQSGSAQTGVLGTDLESNSTADMLVTTSASNELHHLVSGGLIHIVSGDQNMIVGGTSVNLTIDAAASRTFVTGMVPGTYTNSSPTTSFVPPSLIFTADGAGALPGSSGNNMTRPVAGTSLVPGEWHGYRVGSLPADDGFIRISAGGGTSANSKAYIDVSGYSQQADMLETVVFGTAGVEAGRFDANTTANQTRFMLYDITAGTIKRVSIGAADSGGTGYKTLRIPN